MKKFSELLLPFQLRGFVFFFSMIVIHEAEVRPTTTTSDDVQKISYIKNGVCGSGTSPGRCMW